MLKWIRRARLAAARAIIPGDCWVEQAETLYGGATGDAILRMAERRELDGRDPIVRAQVRAAAESEERDRRDGS